MAYTCDRGRETLASFEKSCVLLQYGGRGSGLHQEKDPQSAQRKLHRCIVVRRLCGKAETKIENHTLRCLLSELLEKSGVHRFRPRPRPDFFNTLFIN